MLSDYDCPDCGYERLDKYFSTWQASEKPQRCQQCSGIMVKRAPNVVFHSFKPFDHMTKDGRTHRISTNKQRNDMMRAYGLDPSPYNDTVEAKADVREFKQCIKEEKRDFPERYRKLKEKVKVTTKKEIIPIAERAAETKFETVRA